MQGGEPAPPEELPPVKVEEVYHFDNLVCSIHGMDLTAKGECVQCEQDKRHALEDAEQLKEIAEHPPHYNFGKIEVSDFIEDQELPWPASNVIKYICRFRHKGDPLGDLYKAKEYLERQIKLTESEG